MLSFRKLTQKWRTLTLCFSEMFHLDLNSLNVPFDYGKLETKPHVANAKVVVHTATATTSFSLFRCRQMLTSQMGIMALNRGVHAVMTFWRPKTAIGATMWTRQVVSKMSCIDPVLLLPSPCQQIKGDNMKHFIANGFLPEFLPPRLKQGFVQEHSHLTFTKIKHCEQKSSSFILKKVM